MTTGLTSSAPATEEEEDWTLDTSAMNDPLDEVVAPCTTDAASTSTSTTTTLLVLYSSTSPHRHVKSHQQQAFQILDSLRIPYTMLDGADIDCRSARDDLFVLSGLQAVYPQFFVLRNNEHVAFWGDWEAFYQSHERNCLAQELGFTSAASSVDPTAAPLPSAVATSPINDSSSSEEDMDMLQLESSTDSISPTDFSTMSSDQGTLVPPVTSLGNQVSSGQAALNPQEGASGGRTKGSASAQTITSETSQSGAAATPSSTADNATKASESSSAAVTKTDITIYGATSFVAQNHVLQYLTQVSLHLPREIRVTLAGRSPSKLQALCDSVTRKMDYLNTMNTRAQARCVFDVFVADGSDEAALLDMATKTKCVLNCAGPFRRYSTLVVAACARAGTDYVDITGEVSWAGAMRQTYGPVAQSTGARIISFCGFDSIPSDLSVFACVEALRAARNKKSDRQGDGSMDIERATAWHYCIGMANGGTVHTALDMPVKLEALMRPVPYLLDDPLVLTHPSAQQDASIQATRNRLAMCEWWNQLPSVDTVFNLGVSIPFFMAVVNAKIVHASSVALKYGPKFTYRERFLPVGYAFTTKLGLLSIIPAMVTSMALMLSFAILKCPGLGAWLANWLAPPGSGMSDDACRRGKTEVYAVVESAKHSDGSSDRASCSMTFKGDPGNWCTAQCVTESALCLVLDRNILPPRSLDGFGTPAELLGHALLARLRSTSVRPVSVATSVRQNMAGREWAMY